MLEDPRCQIYTYSSVYRPGMCSPEASSVEHHRILPLEQRSQHRSEYRGKELRAVQHFWSHADLKKKTKLKKQVLQSFHQKMLKMFPHKFTAFSMWAGCWLRVCATFLKCWQSPCACVICVVLVSTFCSSLCFLNSSCCSSSSTHRHLGQVLV